MTLTQGSMNVLLASCVLSACISLPTLAGDGVIVTGRDVQGHIYGRPSFGKDPYPTTANANPSREILNSTGELSDMDIRGVSSGSSISRAILPNGNIPGLNNTQGSVSTLGSGTAVGHGAGAAMGGRSVIRSSVAWRP